MVNAYFESFEPDRPVFGFRTARFSAKNFSRETINKPREKPFCKEKNVEFFQNKYREKSKCGTMQRVKGNKGALHRRGKALNDSPFKGGGENKTNFKLELERKVEASIIVSYANGKGRLV